MYHSAIEPFSRPIRSNASGLRVALFSGNYNYLPDGANQALNRLVEHLENRGATVRVYSPAGRSPAFPPAGTLVPIPSVPIPGRGEYRLATGLPLPVQKDLCRFAPHLIHVSAPDILGRRAQAFARSRGIPVIASLHTRFETYLQFYGLQWLRPLAERYLHRFYARSDMALVPTLSIVDEFSAAGLGSRTRLWSRGVDRHTFDPLRRDLAWRRSIRIADDDIVVLFFGRLVREKGLAQFAATIDALHATGVPVRPLVVGDGPERGWLERRLPSAVFTGHLAGDALGRAVASADVFFNPSRTEAFGNVTLEVMASGVASVCADTPSARALLAEERTALFFAPDDIEGAAEAISNLVKAPRRRAEMGREAREDSLRYDWVSASQMVLNAYVETLASWRGTKRRGAAWSG